MVRNRTVTLVLTNEIIGGKFMLTISYFSYKGGSGRTSLLFNSVPFIAELLGATPESPIVVLDMDTDSKGLSYLLEQECGGTSSINAAQVITNDVTYKSVSGDKSKLFSKMISVGEAFGLDSCNYDSVRFVSATGSEKIFGKANFDSQNMDLTNFQVKCEKFGCKALILDNPAGRQRLADLSLGISDTIITVMRITRQFRAGTIEFLKYANENYYGKEFIVVPNVVPQDSGIFKVSDIVDSVRNSICDIDNGHNEYNLLFLEKGESGIHEVVRFKFEETNLYKRQKELKKYSNDQLEQDEESAITKYRKLAEAVINENS